VGTETAAFLSTVVSAMVLIAGLAMAGFMVISTSILFSSPFFAACRRVRFSNQTSVHR
jgi:hypothetical protein